MRPRSTRHSDQKTFPRVSPVGGPCFDWYFKGSPKDTVAILGARYLEKPASVTRWMKSSAGTIHLSCSFFSSTGIKSCKEVSGKLWDFPPSPPLPQSCVRMSDLRPLAGGGGVRGNSNESATRTLAGSVGIPSIHWPSPRDFGTSVALKLRRFSFFATQIRWTPPKNPQPPVGFLGCPCEACSNPSRKRSTRLPGTAWRMLTPLWFWRLPRGRRK